MNRTREVARELLAFYLEAGVDCAVGESAARPLRGCARPPPRAPRRRGAPATGSSARRARAARRGRASRIGDAPRHRRRRRRARGRGHGGARGRRAAPQASTSCAPCSTSFEGCALRSTAKQLVFADGNPQARVMFVGEAPGARRRHRRACRSSAAPASCSTACWRRSGSTARRPISPTSCRGGRPATARRRRRRSQICLPFIQRQIELADPDILVCLGSPRRRRCSASRTASRKTRGRWFNFHTGTREIRALATFHPAFLLRRPLQKRFAWRDFLAIKKALAESQSADCAAQTPASLNRRHRR